MRKRSTAIWVGLIVLLLPLVAACSGREEAPETTSIPEPDIAAEQAPAVSVSDVFFISDELVITSGSVADSSESDDKGPPVPGASSTLERGEEKATMSFQTSDLEPGIYTVWWVIYRPGQSNFRMALAVGEEVGQDGLGNFEATLEKKNLVQALQSAKVELVVRYHGPPIEGRIEEQKSDLDGGCDIDPDPCQNVQISVHPGSE